MTDIGVAEYDRFRHRTGKVHRPKHPPANAAPGRNRAQYRVDCGNTVRMGFPIRITAVPTYALCGHCWKDTP